MKRFSILVLSFAFISLFTANVFAVTSSDYKNIWTNPIQKVVPKTTSLPLINVLAPTLNQELKEGSEYTIKWESKNIPSNSQVYISIYNGGRGTILDPNANVVLNLPASSTSYSWKVKGNNGWGVGMATPLEKIAKFFGFETANAGSNQYILGVGAVLDSKTVAYASSKPFFISQPIKVPTAKFSTNPTLKLAYDSVKKIPIIEGSAVVEIEGKTNEDTLVYTFGAKLTDNKNKTSYTNATRVTSEIISGAKKSTIEGSGDAVYIIKAGEKAKFKVTLRDNPDFMFAGSYKMSLTNISFVTTNNNDGTVYDYTSIVVPTATSNALAVVGEKGPYINSLKGQTGTFGVKSAFKQNDIMAFEGARLADSKILIDGVAVGKGVLNKNKTILSFNLKDIKNFVPGERRIELENKYGKSNPIYTLFADSTSPAPYISLVVAPAAGDFEIDSEGKAMVEGKNLVYRENDTVAYVGGKKALVTQYGSNYMYITVPKLDLGVYDMYITTTYGKSNIVKVKVITSRGTGTINLSSTCPTTKFERALSVGSSGNDVVALQTFLYSKGYSASVATGYFGASTKASLAAYQVTKGITPADGTFGPISRAAMTADCNVTSTIAGIKSILVSTNTTVNAGSGPNDDAGRFTIEFKVRAENGDAYVSSNPGKTLNYILDRAGVAVGAGVFAAVTNQTDGDTTSSGNYKIEEGEEETFVLSVTAQLPAAGVAGQYRLSMKGIKWSATDVATPSNVYTTGLDTFKTSYISLN